MGALEKAGLKFGEYLLENSTFRNNVFPKLKVLATIGGGVTVGFALHPALLALGLVAATGCSVGAGVLGALLVHGLLTQLKSKCYSIPMEKVESAVSFMEMQPEAQRYLSKSILDKVLSGSCRDVKVKESYKYTFNNRFEWFIAHELSDYEDFRLMVQDPDNEAVIRMSLKEIGPLDTTVKSGNEKERPKLLLEDFAAVWMLNNRESTVEDAIENAKTHVFLQTQDVK